MRHSITSIGIKKFFLSVATVILTSSVFFIGSNQLFAQEQHKAMPQGEHKDMCPKCEQKLADQIDKYAQEVQKQWELPGFSLAISLDNKVILSKGYGVKEQRPADGVGYKGAKFSDDFVASGDVKGVVNEPGALIDPNTLFQVGSISKSFTATVMAQLVAEGKLKWTDSVKNILPDFNMYDDPWVTRNMQIRDVMTHKTGLANEAGTYFPNLGYNRDDIYKMLQYLKPTYSFRTEYDYNNITFMIAVKIIEKLTGKSWEENVQERVFNKLGMTNSALDAAGFGNSKNVATPHDYSYLGKVVTLPLYANEQALYWLTVIGPAGGVNSTANDLIKYAQFHCNNGYLVNRNPDGSVKDTSFIMPRKNVAYLHTGVTITGQDSVHTNLYGHCWFIEQNNHYRLYFHTGTTWGMTAICFFVPEYKLCGVMLVNCEANAYPRYAVMRRAIDLVRRDTVLKDWSTDYYNEWLNENKKSWETQQRETADEAKNFKPEMDKNLFVGNYVKDAPFGPAVVTLENGKLYITIGTKKFKNELVHKTGTTYVFRSDGHGFPITFNFNDKGKKVVGFDLKFGEGEEKFFGGWKKERR